MGEKLENSNISEAKISVVDYTLLFIIIVVATILRFWNFTEMQYMHDELSALGRTDYKTVKEVLYLGVAKYDTHPAGVQLFIYCWTKIFGFNETVVKLPFILLGILSILIAYNISRQWFNSTVGLTVASFMATVQYMVMYSQIARPYISGMFFSLLMVWCWSNYLFENKARWKWLLGYILSSAACAYDHHIALLFACIVGITGLAFLKKNTWKGYIAAGILIFILYIPHLNIFFFQLNKGGLGGPEGWLGKPDNDWLYKYVKYTFHFSYWMYALTAVIILLSIFFSSTEIKQKQKFRIITLLWFLLVFFIQYYYSIRISPIIQYSTLIFVFPFFLIFLFSLFDELNSKLKTFIVLATLTIGTYTLASVRKHYTVFYKQPYQEQILNTYKNLDAIKDEKNATIALTIPYYFKTYYFKKYNRQFEFINYHAFDKKPSPEFFRDFVNSRSTNYFIAGNLPSECIQIIKEKYPYLIDKAAGFTYSTYCFSKLKPSIEIKENMVFSEESKLADIDSATEYGAVKLIKVKDILKDRHTIFNISAVLYSKDTTANPKLVTDITANGQSISWNGASYSDYNNNTGRPNKVLLCYDFTSFDFKKYSDAEMKIYIWNPDKKQIQAGQLKIEAIESNHDIYGLYEPIN